MKFTAAQVALLRCLLVATYATEARPSGRPVADVVAPAGWLLLRGADKRTADALAASGLVYIGSDYSARITDEGRAALRKSVAA